MIEADLLTWLAAAILLVHAHASHGFCFALIWLGLPVAVWLGTGLAVGSFASVRIDEVHDGLRLAVGVYLSALFGKGFVERTRFAGGVLAFAASATLCALPVALAGAPFAHVRVSTALALLLPFVFLFCTAYRSISRVTQRDPLKLLALTALAVPMAWIWWTIACRLARALAFVAG